MRTSYRFFTNLSKACVLIGVVNWTFLNPSHAEGPYQQFHHDNVLGTSLSLTVVGDAHIAQTLDNLLLTEIKRLEVIFSHYRDDSEISRINDGDIQAATNASSELVTVLKACETWQQQLTAGFSCKMGDVLAAWQQHADAQSRPDRKTIRALARRAIESDFSVEQLRAGKPNNDFSWNVGAIAKGFILDQSLIFAREKFPTLQAIAINIGGDSVYWCAESNTGSPWLVAIANPQQLDDSGANNLGKIALTSGAVAYSGHNSRGFTINQRHYSHILAPRDGWPTTPALTTVVKAPSAIEADAITTGLAAMQLAEALDWLTQHPGIAALIIAEDGRHYASENWYENFEANNAKNQPVNATIQFSLPDIEADQYRRPYVALWIADDSNKIIKNLLLLGDSERWMSENRYWWRRQGRREPELLLSLARPTRRAGEYQLIWNGRDDYGNIMAPGEYSLWIEAAREHGDHERIAIKFSLSLKENDLDLIKSGEKEIQQLRIQISK